MALYRTKAIVLRTRNFGEADRILVLFSEEFGKFEAVVKGARRQRSRFLGNTLAFSYIQTMLFTGKNLDTLSQAELILSFTKLREDLIKLAYAGFWAELVDAFIPERQEAREVFRFLLAAFIVLEKTADPMLLNLAFEVRLLHYLGYQPQLEVCTHCGGSLDQKSWFSAEAGGALCSGCRGRYRDVLETDSNSLKVIAELGEADLRELDSLYIETGSIQIIQKVLRSFIETRLDHPLKSQVFLDNISS